MAVSTYNAIGTVTLSSAQSQVTFSNIPQIYTDLVLVSIGKMSSGGDANQAITFNGDSGSVYSRQYMYTEGTTTFSGRTTTTTSLAFPYWNSTNPVTTIVQIGNYNSNVIYKTAISRNAGSSTVTAETGQYRSTSAITSITLTGNTTFASGSTFSLYGVGANQLKASGGDVIVSDGTYWYHAFKSSGTFTPNSTLSCEALVIAGGGGGGGEIPGAGGAGGLRYASGLSISTATSVTVGAGGAGSLGSAGTDIGASGGNSVFSTITSAGGGGGAGASNSGAAGGSGGGGWVGGGAGTGGAASPVTSPVQGYAGGTGGAGYPGIGGGGGGAGGVGAAGGSTDGTSGVGGIGVSTYSTWGLITGTGSNHSAVIYFAGGGGGGTWNGNADYKGGAGGFGGGGSGWGATGNAGTGGAGAVNTGGGGGGGGNSGSSIGGAGGSGLVIVRYAV